MGVVRIDDASPISRGGGHNVDNGFDAGQEERNENDIQPHRRQHQRPEWCLGFARLHQRRESEMPGDQVGSRRPLGHGTRESMYPMSPTKSKMPSKNCMCASDDAESKTNDVSYRSQGSVILIACPPHPKPPTAASSGRPENCLRSAAKMA